MVKASLLKKLGVAIQRQVLDDLPQLFAEKFDLDKSAVEDILDEYFGTELKGTVPRRNKSKKPASAYVLFSGEERKKIKEANPGIAFGEISKVIAKKWAEMSKKDQSKWVEKAAQLDAERGVVRAPAKSKAAKSAPKSQAKTPAKATSVKVTKDEGSGMYVIVGTKYVVRSVKNKVVTGKLRGTNKVNLSAADRKKCEEHGYQVEAEPAAAAPSKAKKSKKAEPVEDDAEEDEEAEEDEDADEEEAEEDEDAEDDDDEE